MGRFDYDGDFDGPDMSGLWAATTRRSLRSKRGQAVLRELLAALLAMPTRELIAGALVKPVWEAAEPTGNRYFPFKPAGAVVDGQTCAIGEFAVYRLQRDAGLDRLGALAQLVKAYDLADPLEGMEDEATLDCGGWLGMARVVAEVVATTNDEAGVAYMEDGRHKWRSMTPAERWQRVVDWVRAQLAPAEAPRQSAEEGE